MAREFPDDDPSREEPSVGVPRALAPGPAQPHPVSVGQALSFAVDEPHAKRNLLVASVMLLVPVAGWLALQGWACETQHRLLENDPAPAPRLRLRDLPHYVRRGWAAGFVEALGIGVLWAIAALFMLSANVSALAAVLGVGSLIALLVMLGGGLVFATVVLGSVTVVFNSMLTRAELTESLPEALSIKDAWRESRPVRRRTFAAYLVFAPIATLLVAVGAALCGVGLLPALVIVKLAGAHLRWQLYSERVHRGGVALRAKPPERLPSERRLALPPPSLDARGARR